MLDIDACPRVSEALLLEAEGVFTADVSPGQAATFELHRASLDPGAAEDDRPGGETDMDPVVEPDPGEVSVGGEERPVRGGFTLA